MPGYLLLALLAGACGFGLIFSAWRRTLSGRWRTPAVIAGWLGLLASAAFWVRASGVEFGITLALLVPSLLAWGLVIRNRQRRHRRGRRARAPVTTAHEAAAQTREAAAQTHEAAAQGREAAAQTREAAAQTREPAAQLGEGVAPRSWPRHLALFLLAVPGAGAAGTLMAVALSLLLPWQAVNAMLLVFVVLPLLWGGLAYWACADSRLLRPTLASLAGALLSAAWIYG